MKVNTSLIHKVFGDRILVRRMERPEKVRGFFIPESYAKEKRKEQSIWFGVIEKFGLDSWYADAYDLREGDIVGISDIGNSNASFEGEDGQEHVWVMEEFIVLRDEGRIKDFYMDKSFNGVGLLPIGAYSIVKPYPEEDKRRGVYLPASDEKQNLTGKVISVSKGEVKNGEIKPLRVTLDSDILFGKYSGLHARFANEEFLLIKEEDIIAEFESAKELAHA